MKQMSKLLISLLVILTIFSCTKKEKNNDFKVGVFIPGVLSGNSTYELIKEAADEITNENKNIEIKVFEAGYNQSKWLELLTSFTASDSYDIIITSNPALPEICNEVSKQFTNQKFLITDAYYRGNSNISTYMFNQYEQSYFLGVIAGLISESSEIKNIEKTKKIGFLVAQEFPLITKHILPGFLLGIKEVNTEYEIDYRVVGNWYDTTKAYDLTKSMIKDSKINVMSIIAGSSSQGAIKAAKELNKYIVYPNTDEYNNGEGVILACGIIELKKLTKQLILDASKNNIEYGTHKVLGFKEGYIGFADTDIYKKNMPLNLQKKINTIFNDLKTGEKNLITPEL